MSLKFNTDRPKISDEEINKQKNFSQLVERFKQQSIKQARGDESWWKNKKISYSAVIAGVTVVCTVTYFSLFKNQSQKTKANEIITTQTTSTTKSSKTTKPAFINSPSKKLQTPYSTFKINNAVGGVVKHPSSSTIKIAKNSFVDKQGKDIIGDVIIEYKEFHDVGDIIANGIPMAYDSAGIKYNLETAGMFDIKGTQNGNPVFIKKDKPLEIELASKNSELRFNQYYLDTLERNWKYIQKDKVKFNPTKELKKELSHTKSSQQIKSEGKLEQLQKEIEVVIPRKKDSVQVVYATKIQKLPVAKAPAQPKKHSPNKPTFKLDGSYEEFPELASFNNVLFEVGAENKNYTEELHTITWSDVKISQGPQKGKNYLLTLVYRNRIEKLIVYPVFSSEEFVQAEKIYEAKFSEYERSLKKRTQEENRLMEELKTKQATYLAEQKKKQDEYDREKAVMLAKYDVEGQNALQSNFSSLTLNVKATRLFRISQFGIFNSDCPHPSPSKKSVKPIFVLNEKSSFFIPEFVYVVDHSNKSVYTYDKTNGFEFMCDPEFEYSICVFFKNKMLICSKSEFKQILTDNSNKFLVKQLDNSADNLIDFKKALEL